eukprot:CAMPEP_0172414770 /NCGR_PEP_ID=MMETSP1064-20121228/1394_1 /TAXON_ID=202472 /ORGANISM="Aulacoseira subarctica , Strain CCAP 1002/5" /LENGTH=640 /DNA_ID=CAMNT_0013151585 /DNA_START=81 /DNA_END=2003 /DNA_ORIENTATION=-
MKFSTLSLALFFIQNETGNTGAASLRIDGNNWKQVSPSIAFQHNNDLTIDRSVIDHATDLAINRMLYSSEENPTYMYQPIDSSQSYDEYQLAWHSLGIYLDCSSENSYGTCVRQVLYAVYVNPNYRGGGIGEYTFYDKASGEWKCYGQGSTCITKMDCHLSDTKWKLLGTFKINNISEGNGWMEQLFKHQGVCIWGDDTYSFATTMRQNMPNRCKSTKQQLDDGSYLYYDTKPAADGNITLALYTDNMCSQEYIGTDYDVWQLSGADKSNWVVFNEALDVYKQCQPCVAYDISANSFECYDKAGYTNCNQCMKFSNKAGCKVATRDEVLLAERQNGLVPFGGDGQNYGKEGYVIEKQAETAVNDSSVLFISSIVFSLLGLAMFVVTSIMKLNQKEDIHGDPKEPSGFVINSILKSMSNSERSSSLLGEPTSEQSWLQRKMVSFSPSKECDDKDLKTQEGSADRSTKTSNSSLSVILLGSTLYKKLSASFAHNKTAPEVDIVPKSASALYVPPAADSTMDTVSKVEDSLEQISQVPATSSSNIEASMTPSQSIPAAASLVPAVDDAALVSKDSNANAPAMVGGGFVEVISEPSAVVNNNSGIPIEEDYAEINADEVLSKSSKKSKRSRSSSRSRLSKFFHR